MSAMIVPMTRNEAFLSDVAAAEVPGGFAMWWLGQSGFPVKHRGRHLLLDPCLSDSLTKKYAGSDMPRAALRRAAEQR